MGAGTSQPSSSHDINGNGRTSGKALGNALRCHGWMVSKCVRQWKAAAAINSEITIPPPGKGQVRVKLYAAAVNPVDAKRAAFGYQVSSSLFTGGLSRGTGVASTMLGPETLFPFPYVMGVEGAGVIESVGWDSSKEQQYDFQVGDRVAFLADMSQPFGGTFCQYAVVHADALGKIPAPTDGNDFIDFVEASTMPCSAGAAYVALFDKLRVERGRSIFISGASGGVGSVAVQLAKYVGLCVLASCSTVNVPYVSSLGADFVFDYTTNNVVKECLEHTQSVGVDYVLELADAALAAKHAEALRFGGSICVLPGPMNANDANSGVFFRKQISVSYVCLAGLYGSEVTRKLLRSVVEESLRLYQNGAFRLHVETASIERVRDVMDVVASGHARGKIVLTDFHPTESPGVDAAVGSRRRKQVRDAAKLTAPAGDAAAR